ncbi:MAG: hypothetical protein K8L99_35705 [Anaerolineae bacterium]|nr:hypothetical protein [Anaerolineae bacterium]
MSFMKNVFGGGTKAVRCPRCLNINQIPNNRTNYVCDKRLIDQHGTEGDVCGYMFPDLYVQHYGEAEHAPIQVFGWTSHGKTVYLHVLRRMLMELGQVWSNYKYTAISDGDVELSRWLRKEMENGVMPPATQWMQLRENYIYIMQLDNMVRWHSRFLMVMDHAGEHFETQADLEVHHMPYLTNKNTATLMVVSIPRLRGTLIGKEAAEYRQLELQSIKQDLEVPALPRGEHFGRSMDELLTNYIQAMITYDKQEAVRNQGGGLLQRGKQIYDKIRQRRKLVVVLTMADAMIQDLPPRLSDYLVNDDTWDILFDRRYTEAFDSTYMEKYMARMRKVSDAIRDWLWHDMRDIGGDQFVKSLESQNIEARFTLVSSLGHNEVSLREEIHGQPSRGMKVAPKRVLDPFFWLLEYQKFSI